MLWVSPAIDISTPSKFWAVPTIAITLTVDRRGHCQVHHLMTHHFVSCHRMSYYIFILPIHYLLPTEWQLSNSYKSSSASSSIFCHLPYVYTELLEPASIDRVLMSDLSVRH